MTVRSEGKYAPMVLCDMYTRGAPQVMGTEHFTRGSSAWYQINAAAALWFKVGNDVRRSSHQHKGNTGTYTGTLLEATRTNDVLWNRDLTNAAWVKTTCTATKDQLGVDFVSNSASKLVATAGNATCLQTITTASATRAMTAFVARTTGSGTIQMTMDGGTTWRTLSGLGFNWQRFEIAVQTLANPVVGFRIVTNGDAIKVDLVQNEVGGFASSPIDTTTAAATRNGDSYYYDYTPTPQALDISVKFMELGSINAVSTVSVVLAIAALASPTFFIYNPIGTPKYTAFHRENVSTDVQSQASEAPVRGDIVELRTRLGADGSVQLGQSINQRDEIVAAKSAANPFAAAWSAGQVYLGANGEWFMLLLDFKLYGAPTQWNFTAENDLQTKPWDIKNMNLVVKPSSLADAEWTKVAPATATNAVATGVYGVSYSRISNGTSVGGQVVQNVPIRTNGPKRLSWSIKHDGATGQDLTLLYDQTTGTKIRVDYTFNSDGTITIAPTTGTIRSWEIAPGEYEIVAEVAAVDMTHVNSVYAGDAGGALGAGAALTWLISNIVLEEIPSVTKVYRNRLKAIGTLSLDIASAWTKGLAAYGIGAVNLSNPDNGLDALVSEAFDGYPIEFYIGDVDKNGNLHRTLLFSGTMEQPDFDLKGITVPVRTATYSLDRAAVPTVLQGTGGLEGDSTVKGKTVQRVYGWMHAVEPILLINIDLTYLMGDRSIVIQSLWEGGQTLAKAAGPGSNGQFLSVALMNAASWGVPSSGQFMFAFENGRTYIRLQTTPTMQLVAFGLEVGTTSSIQSGDLLNKILTDAAAPINTTYYDATYPSQAVSGFGVFVNDTTTTFADIISQIVASIGGWMWLNPLNNMWVIGNLPSFSTLGASCVIPRGDIKSMRKLGNPHTPGEGVPPSGVVVRSAKKAVTQTSFLTLTSQNLRAWLSAEFTERSYNEPLVKQKWPLSLTAKLDAPALMDATDFPATTVYADTLAAAYHAALTYGWDFWQIVVGLSPKLLTPVVAVDLGVSYYWVPATMPTYKGFALGVKHNRYGFTEAGKGTKCGVMNVSLDMTRREVTFLVYTKYEVG